MNSCCGPAGPKDLGCTEFPPINDTWNHVIRKPSLSVFFQIQNLWQSDGSWTFEIILLISISFLLSENEHISHVCQILMLCMWIPSSCLCSFGAGFLVFSYWLLCSLCNVGYHSGLRISWQFLILEWHWEFWPGYQLRRCSFESITNHEKLWIGLYQIRYTFKNSGNRQDKSERKTKKGQIWTLSF